MKLITSQCILVILLTVTLLACTTQKQSSQDLKEKTAEATAEMKSDAKAIASGIREGWSRDKPLDINGASKDQLMSLPGMSPAQADRVIAGRPYDAPTDLKSRHIIPDSEYDRIADKITAKK
jgi:DNA uptake protein ComE-like DNA-binding protein